MKDRFVAGQVFLQMFLLLSQILHNFQMITIVLGTDQQRLSPEIPTLFSLNAQLLLNIRCHFY